MQKSSFETEKPSSEPGGCSGLEKLLQKNLKNLKRMNSEQLQEIEALNKQTVITGKKS